MIRLNHVKKSFGEKSVLEDVSFTVNRGEIVILTGRNGCGKTVLLKMICGINQPDDGEIFFEKPENPRFGVIIENAGFWRDKSGYECLKYLAGIRNIIGEKEIVSWLSYVDLYDAQNQKVKGYSLGMRQRLAIAQAFMENPDVILLDEPSNALDDHGLEILNRILLQEKEKGKAVVIATHNQEDFKGIADRHLFVQDRHVLEAAV